MNPGQPGVNPGQRRCLLNNDLLYKIIFLLIASFYTVYFKNDNTITSLQPVVLKPKPLITICWA